MESRHLTLPAPPPAAARYAHLPLCGAQHVSSGQLATLPFMRNGFLIAGVCSGSFSFSYEEQSFALSSGAAAAFPATGIVPLLAEQESELIYGVLTGEAADTLLGETLRTSVYFPQGSAALAECLLPIFQTDDMDTACDGAMISATAYGLLLRLYGASAQPDGQSAYPPLICGALAMLQEEFVYLYGIEDLADRLGVSAPHLIRQFTRSVGITPGRYLTHLRIEYAKLVLRGGETSIEAVAASAGFSGASYFGKVFRRETGMTPRQYAATTSAIRSEKVDAIYL